jgi:hypothetical protein
VLDDARADFDQALSERRELAIGQRVPEMRIGCTPSSTEPDHPAADAVANFG